MQAPARRRLLGALALAPALGGCAHWTPPMGAALRAQRPASLPARARLTEVGFVPQDDSLCGPAVLAMLLAHAGLATDLDTLQAEVYLPGREGTLQAEMLTGARRHGALAVELPPRLEAVLAEAAGGTPVGVLLNLGLAWLPRWHYAVLLGHDLDRGTVWLHSGQTPQAEWSLVSFENTWARGGHWSFVALGAGRLPQQAAPADVLRGLLGLDRSRPAAEVAPRWALAAQCWPDDLALGLGEGNAWLAAGALPKAAASFQRLALQQDSAVAWNNLAQVQARQGDRKAARQSAQQALRRAREAEPRWLDAVQQTWQELSD